MEETDALDAFEKALAEADLSQAEQISVNSVGADLQELTTGGTAQQALDLSKELAELDEEDRRALVELRPWQRAYLAALRAKGNASLAARASNVSNRTVRKYREANSFFDEMCDEAMTFNDDMVEGRAYHLGFEGYFEPIYQGGALVGKKLVFSERLLEILLKARKPEKFGAKNPGQLPPGQNAPELMPVSQVAELVRALSPTLAAGVIASRPQIIDIKTEVVPA